MLVPDIFQSKAKPIAGGMQIRDKKDDEIYILNLSGDAYCDDWLSQSVNSTMFKHISIKKKDVKKLVKLLSEIQGLNLE